MDTYGGRRLYRTRTEGLRDRSVYRDAALEAGALTAGATPAAEPAGAFNQMTRDAGLDAAHNQTVLHYGLRRQQRQDDWSRYQDILAQSNKDRDWIRQLALDRLGQKNQNRQFRLEQDLGYGRMALSRQGLADRRGEFNREMMLRRADLMGYAPNGTPTLSRQVADRRYGLDYAREMGDLPEDSTLALTRPSANPGLNMILRDQAGANDQEEAMRIFGLSNQDKTLTPPKSKRQRKKTLAARQLELDRAKLTGKMPDGTPTIEGEQGLPDLGALTAGGYSLDGVSEPQMQLLMEHTKRLSLDPSWKGQSSAQIAVEAARRAGLSTERDQLGRQYALLRQQNIAEQGYDRSRLLRNESDVFKGREKQMTDIQARLKFLDAMAQPGGANPSSGTASAPEQVPAQMPGRRQTYDSARRHFIDRNFARYSHDPLDEDDYRRIDDLMAKGIPATVIIAELQK